ncbi:hypothetical protein JHK82_057051 [Glycine max]|nr:hypothetical protein JHK85_057906 [Glycine max]KAG5075713.1 hypothetical protein JHK84_056944 [Glycine max]KAG5078356.1 hypothetical protein JHK82_057051 [Glycine max]
MENNKSKSKSNPRRALFNGPFPENGYILSLQFKLSFQTENSHFLHSLHKINSFLFSTATTTENHSQHEAIHRSLALFRYKSPKMSKPQNDPLVQSETTCGTLLYELQTDQNAGSLKEEHARILPQLEEMQKRKIERRNQFIEIQEQIQSISIEIYGPREYIPAVEDETDLSLRKLEELHRQLHALQIEKSSRLKQVQEHLCTLNSLCLVLGFDFKQTINGIHPSLVDSKGSKSVSNDTIQQLAVAIQELREVKLQRMQKVEVEVARLEALKSSKMKELVLKKRTELEEICRKTHLIPEIDNAVESAVEAIESAMVDGLTSKTISWEKEKGIEFTYDGIRLLSMVEEYNILRQEKEQERRRQRDLKKLQGQMIAEQEALYGSKPSPSKPQSVKKGPRMSTGGGAASRRVSLGGAMLQTPKPDSKSTHSRAMRKVDKVHQIEHLNYLDDGISGLSAARRGLDIAGAPVKKHSFGAGTQIIESPLIRQPFSPISSNSVSSKANVANATDELSKQNEKLQRTVSLNNGPFTTPSKTVPTVVDEENRTPNIPAPATPSTVSVPMNMAMTPVPSSILKNVSLNSTPISVPYGNNDLVQEVEYSFEEKRLSYYMLA